VQVGPTFRAFLAAVGHVIAGIASEEPAVAGAAVDHALAGISFEQVMAGATVLPTRRPMLSITRFWALLNVLALASLTLTLMSSLGGTLKASVSSPRGNH